VITTPDYHGPGSSRRETAADRRARPCFHDIAISAADKHGVCARPFVMRTLDLDTGDGDYVAVACKSTMESQCRPCAKKARLVTDAALRDGWHLDHEPVEEAKPAKRGANGVVGPSRGPGHRIPVGLRGGQSRRCRGAAGGNPVRRHRAARVRYARAHSVTGCAGRHHAHPFHPRRQDAPDLPTRQVRTTTVGANTPENTGRRCS